VLRNEPFVAPSRGGGALRGGPEALVDEMNEKPSDEAGAAEGPRPTEPPPLLPATLRRLSESAAASGSGAEFAELVRAFTEFETQRAAALEAARQQALAAQQADRNPTRTRVVSGRFGMALAVAALAGSSAVALAYTGVTNPPARPGTPAGHLTSSDSSPARGTTGPGTAATTTGRTTGNTAHGGASGGTATAGGGGSVGGTAPGGQSAAGTTGTGSTGAGTTGGTGTTGGSGTPATTGAPSTASSPSSSGTGGPTTLAGLCNAYAHGGLPTHSSGYARLVAAAGGADRIPAYCAALTSPAGGGAVPTTP
jgi:hypothetical protein